ncbi:MAG: glycosyltransferase [Legionella sp.]|uniref:glycosyltransferase n=1 Tax=Legionella sp. TaxID=459 RepID=UPI0039E37BFD
MLTDYILSKNLTGRFAVVKLWPELKAAEDECIARLKIAADVLGLECLEIYADGRFINDTSHIITTHDVDFVIHLHYDTPKLYDAFSFVTLWNPVRLYHQWGYARCSRNLLSHDDFLSCSSQPADNHVRRLIRNSSTHLPPFFNLYPSVSDIVNAPSLGDQKLFYAGINWDVLGGGVTRHQELLKLLDNSGDLRIYGPQIFQGVQVWKGYKSYVREIPFDGISIIKEISTAGISLVLSSEAHKQSELMTNRLFESIAAGAVIICDENNFAKRFFGNTLLYIDTRCEVEKTAEAIFKHLMWVKENPELALEMVSKAQQLFKKHFSLKKNIQDLYEGLLERKRKIRETIYPENLKKIKVNVYFLMPEYRGSVLESHIASITTQDYTHFSATLVIDKMEAAKNHKHLQSMVNRSPVSIEILEVDYYHYGADKKIKRLHNLGEVILHLVNNLSKDADAILFVAPNEKIFSNHLSILAGSLARNPNAGCAASAVILKHQHCSSYGSQHETIDFRQLSLSEPIGYSRFIFRVSMLANDLDIALPYLHKKTMAALIDNNKLVQEAPATVFIQTSILFPAGNWDEGQENELLGSYCPTVFNAFSGFEIKLPAISHERPRVIQKRSKHVKWVIAQIRALHQEGLSARVHAMKVKFKSVTQK